MTKNDDMRRSDLLHRRTQELKTMMRVSQFINILDLDEVLMQTLQITAEVSGATKGSFFLLDDDCQPKQRFITQRNMPPAMTRSVAQDVVKNGLAGWCVRNRESAVVEDVQKDERWYVFADDNQKDVRSALCVPVLYEDNVSGVMTLVHPDVSHFDDGDLTLITAVANQASSAIRNARLFDNLETKREQLELVINNTGEALLAIDSDLVVTLATPQAISLIGEKPGTVIIGQHVDKLDTREFFVKIIKRIKDQKVTGGSHSFEVRDDEQERDFAITISVFKEEQHIWGSGYVILIHDVTSLKDLSRLKTHMLHMLTHDLKNPMNIIWGYVDLLRIDTQQSLPADPRFIDGVLRSLQRMENLIDETLNVERFISAGMTHIEDLVYPDEVIDEAIQDLEQLAENKKLTVERKIQDDLRQVMGNRFQIREAMSNLISNAIKYTPEEGRILVMAHQEDDRFHFSVEDNGFGVPKELQAKLFNEFYRAYRPELEGIAGTGLGLSLVKTAVEQHQGQVWFQSEEGVGSTFGFWLPLQTEA